MSHQLLSLALATALSLPGVAMAAPSVNLNGQRIVANKAPPTVLYSQLALGTGQGYSSQDFEAANNAFDCNAADDFVVPAGVKWKVSEVYVVGQHRGVTPNSANVSFYKNLGGKPGTLVADVPMAPITRDLSGSLTVALPTPVTLKAGTYWVSVQAQLDYPVGGQWFWHVTGGATGSQAAWKNPGNGFGTNCTDWGNLNSCLATGTNGDMLFELRGKAKPVQ